MSGEASKTRAVRDTGFYEKYLQGRVIDIGCGPDPIVPHAEAFDLQHGDAQHVASLRPCGAYDAVCSSHCLEHMRDVPAALAQWWALVRPGGYLILVVPDEDLYEQGGWPSLFNSDHKATFRMGKVETWSPVSYDILELARSLPGAQIVSCQRHDRHYDHALRKSRITSLGRLLFRAHHFCNAVLRQAGAQSGWPGRATMRLFVWLGAPVDQTEGPALAQIELVARKRL
jgi:SAM-dependent methyltransferase